MFPYQFNERNDIIFVISNNIINLIVMKNLDLATFGVREMSQNEKLNVNGGREPEPHGSSNPIIYFFQAVAEGGRLFGRFVMAAANNGARQSHGK